MVGPAARMRSRRRSGTISAVDHLDVDQVDVDDLVVGERLLADRLQAAPRLPCRRRRPRHRPIVSAQLPSVREPDGDRRRSGGWRSGSSCCQLPAARPRPPVAPVRGERLGTVEVGAGDGVADDDHDRTGQVVARSQATAGRRACRGTRRRSRRLAFSTTATAVSGDRPASISRVGDVGRDRAAHIDGNRRAGDGKLRPVGQRARPSGRGRW